MDYKEKGIYQWICVSTIGWISEMDEQEACYGHLVYYRGRVYGNYSFLQGEHLANEIEFRCRDKLESYYITIHCDCNNAICIDNNLTFHAKTTHIDIQYHFLNDMVKDGKAILEKVDTLCNVVDVLAKGENTNMRNTLWSESRWWIVNFIFLAKKKINKFSRPNFL